MHAEVQRIVGRIRCDDLAEPGARNHHGSACHEPFAYKIHKRRVRAMTHSEIVDVQDYPSSECSVPGWSPGPPRGIRLRVICIAEHAQADTFYPRAWNLRW